MTLNPRPSPYPHPNSAFHRVLSTQDLIYTWVGADQSVLVSLNPFKRLPIYGADALSANAAPAPNTVRDPHTYAIASAAYHYIRREAKDTSILISGESGAGKTETVKILMAHLAYISAGDDQSVIRRVIESNPLLESFGNAKTVRNDNSSRFGKFTQLQFDKDGALTRLVGSRCEVRCVPPPRAHPLPRVA